MNSQTAIKVINAIEASSGPKGAVDRIAEVLGMRVEYTKDIYGITKQVVVGGKDFRSDANPIDEAITYFERIANNNA